MKSHAAPVQPEQQGDDIQRTANQDMDEGCARAVRVGDRSSHHLQESLAISLGVAAMPMPAFLNASIFAAAVPLPPLTMAPAWPMRRPGGAVAPAMKPATGFRQFF